MLTKAMIFLAFASFLVAPEAMGWQRNSEFDSRELAGPSPTGDFHLSARGQGTSIPSEDKSALDKLMDTLREWAQHQRDMENWRSMYVIPNIKGGRTSSGTVSVGVGSLSGMMERHLNAQERAMNPSYYDNASDRTAAESAAASAKATLEARGVRVR